MRTVIGARVSAHGRAPIAGPSRDADRIGRRRDWGRAADRSRAAAPCRAAVLARARRVAATASTSPTIRSGARWTRSDDDVREGIAAWYARMGDAWDAWDAEMQAFRGALACAARRAARRLRRAQVERRTGAARDPQYVRCGAARRRHAGRVRFAGRDPARIRTARTHCARRWSSRAATGASTPRTSSRPSARDADLVVVSQVIFTTGQRLADLSGIVAAAHARGRATAARRLPRARRVSGRRRGARRRFCRRRQLQVPARRPGRVLPLSAPAPPRRRAAHARHRMVCQARSVRLRAPRSAAIWRGRRRAFWNPRRRCCRSTRRARGRSSRWRWAWTGCARIRWKCSSDWRVC